MTPARRKKAVAVASDVIAQLRVNRLQAERGTYCAIDMGDMGSLLFFDKEHELAASFQKSFAEDKRIKCRVCAIGAAYIGYINRFNKVTNGEMQEASSEDMLKRMEDVFDRRQLRLMERIFENFWEDLIDNEKWASIEDFKRKRYKALGITTEEQIDHFEAKATAYHNKYPDSDDLLRAIMLNVVRNKGEFILPKKKV